jgi:hypothetical protein
MLLIPADNWLLNPKITLCRSAVPRARFCRDCAQDKILHRLPGAHNTVHDAWRHVDKDERKPRRRIRETCVHNQYLTEHAPRRPHFLIAVPRLYDSIHDGIKTKFAKESAVKRALIAFFTMVKTLPMHKYYTCQPCANVETNLRSLNHSLHLTCCILS